MIEYPPQYDCLVWNYNLSDQNAITKALDQVDWNFFFFDRKVHDQASIFNRTLMNIFSSFIRSKLVTFNNKDSAWMISNLRDEINWNVSV